MGRFGEKDERDRRRKEEGFETKNADDGIDASSSYVIFIRGGQIPSPPDDPETNHIIISPSPLLCSPFASVPLDSPHPHPSFPRIPRLQFIPLEHTPRLHTDHLSPAALGTEVGHSTRLLLPRVPNNHVEHHIPCEFVAGLAVLEHGDGLVGWGGVDAVRLGGDGDGFVGCGGFLRRGGGLGGGEHFIDVGGGFETRDCGLVDILRVERSSESAY